MNFKSTTVRPWQIQLYISNKKNYHINMWMACEIVRSWSRPDMAENLAIFRSAQKIPNKDGVPAETWTGSWSEICVGQTQIVSGLRDLSDCDVSRGTRQHRPDSWFVGADTLQGNQMAYAGIWEHINPRLTGCRVCLREINLFDRVLLYGSAWKFTAYIVKTIE